MMVGRIWYSLARPRRRAVDAAFFLSGQGITNLGTWASRIGLILAVYSTVKSSAATAIVVLVDAVPRALFARRIANWIRIYTPAKVFVIGCVGEASLTLLCMVAIHLSVYLLFILILIRTVFSCALGITIQSVTPILFGRGQAIRRFNLASGLVNALAVIGGPIVGASLWQAGGLNLLLPIDALSSVIAMFVVLIPLSRIRNWPTKSNTNVFAPEPRMSQTLLVLANTVAVTGGGIFNVLLPLFAIVTLRLSANNVGTLFASFGAGAIAATMLGAAIKTNVSTELMFRSGFAISAMSMIGIYMSLISPYLLIFFAGAASALRAVGVMTKLQQISSDSDLPAAMARLQAYTSWGIAIGSLGGAIAATQISPRTGLLIVGILSLSALALSMMRDDLALKVRREQSTKE